jgi:hypothetical protein
MSSESGSHAATDDGQDVKQDIKASETSASLPEITEAQAKRILLKTDLVIMPLIVLSMTLAFLDKVRTNFNLVLERADRSYRTRYPMQPSSAFERIQPYTVKTTAGLEASSTLGTWPWNSQAYGS